MANSILRDVKKVLNIGPDDDAFDIDVMMHINSVFSTLEQLGLGPVGGLMITDDSTTWDQFYGLDNRLNAIQTYVYLRVKLLFDPPQNSYHTTSIKEQIKELEWRLNVTREGDSWVPPTPQP